MLNKYIKCTVSKFEASDIMIGLTTNICLTFRSKNTFGYLLTTQYPPLVVSGSSRSCRGLPTTVWLVLGSPVARSTIRMRTLGTVLVAFTVTFTLPNSLKYMTHLFTIIFVQMFKGFFTYNTKYGHIINIYNNNKVAYRIL